MSDRLIYKDRRESALYHERCGEFVLGNGSRFLPYRCACGEWKYDMAKHDWRLKDE